MYEILLVDDERAMREGLKALLAGEGFAVRTARDGDDALKKIAERRPDLVLLDVMMPRMNGFRVCEEIRGGDRLLPVIFLTAKDSEADQVRGIGLGADDYISKDADEAVLLARVRRALSRTEDFDSVSAVLKLGRVKVDLDSLSVAGGAGGEEKLTRTEGGILRLLAASAGRFLTKAEIVEGLRGRDCDCEEGMVYVHVHNLRRKLGVAAGCIVNDRLSGYKIVK
ncbi:MAG: response regulator transcription factor [Kiritimatiellae bacterium]|nr:response regulator transcription factor [Kiritimatiellia bacterium]